MICLELMDLEDPEGEGGQAMELPPLMMEQKPPTKPEEPLRLKRTPRDQDSMSAAKQRDAQAALPPPELPPVSLSAPMAGTQGTGPPSAALPPMPIKSYSEVKAKTTEGLQQEPVEGSLPTPGISPMILPQPTRTVKQEPAPMKPAVKAGGAVTMEVKAPEVLKALEPPPAEAVSLKMSSTSGETMYAEVPTPEIPLLAGKAKAEEGTIRRQDVPLALKPAKGKVASLGRDPGFPQGREGVFPGVFYGKWEDLDPKLVEIYDRFYK